MSLCNLFHISLKVSRQAYILANSRLLTSPNANRLPVIFGIRRSAHNSLYYMVKKRTLEARAKLQPNKYPNNHACMSPTNNLQDNREVKYNESECQNVSSPPFVPPITYQSQDRRSVCDNKKQLKINERSNVENCKPDPIVEKCRVKKDPCAEYTKSFTATCKDGGNGGGVGPGEQSDNNKLFKLKCLFAALAALGTGSLLTLLLMRGSKSKKVGGGGGSSDGFPNNNQLRRAQLAGLATVPPSSADLPKHVPYLLIGGGTAAFSAFRAIKTNDAHAKVLMITNEFRKPYMRPPLSKELWYTPDNDDETHQAEYRFKQWTGAERSLYFEPDEFFVDPAKLDSSLNGGIAVAQGFTVKKINPTSRIVTLMDGYEISYDECLIATGCAPKNLVIFRDAPPGVREKVMVYRNPEDYDRLRRYAAERRTITIVGNGFIGSELACSLAHHSKEKDGGKVYQVFQEPANMSKILPDYLGRWTMLKMEALGVCVMPNATIKSVARNGAQLELALNNGKTLLTDIVVVCVGCTPNTALANVSGLEIDHDLGGFVVNAELEARRNLYVAGDVSCFYDPLLGRRRVEHHDHSVVSGRLAGENMTGKKKPYTHQSMFWSDLGPEIGYEGIGLVDSALPTVGVFALPSKIDRTADNLTELRKQEEPESLQQIKVNPNAPDVKCDPTENANYGKGVIFYLKNDKIVGILLWNLFNRIGLARTIINQDKKYGDLNEVAKLFEIHV